VEIAILCIYTTFAALFSKLITNFNGKSMAISFFPLQKQQYLRKEPFSKIKTYVNMKKGN
jgi:hypothetical protein